MTDEQKAALRKAASQATPPALRYWPTAAVLRSLNLDPDASRLMSITHPAAVLALLDEVERLREALPEEVTESMAPKCMGKLDALSWELGWNSCRLRMLAALEQST